jgi:hypothetical protein
MLPRCLARTDAYGPGGSAMARRSLRWRSSPSVGYLLKTLRGFVDGTSLLR